MSILSLDIALQNAFYSMCQISHDGLSKDDSIQGVLLSFRTDNGKLHHGVLTGKHNQFLEDGVSLTFSFHSEFVGMAVVTSQTFRFTCPFLDVTYLELDASTISALRSQGAIFLNVDSSHVRGFHNDHVYHIQKSTELPEVFTQHRASIKTCWGFTIQHNRVNNSNTQPIFDVTLDGLLQGVCRHENYQSEEVVTTVRAVYIMNALNILLVHTIKEGTSDASYKPAKRLSETEIRELSKIGLQRTPNEYLFISPDGFQVTTLWFYRTNHAWYWTPTKPKTLTNEKDIRECNWLPIGVGLSMKVLGGHYQDQKPAQRNIMLINTLAETFLKYLQ